MSATNDVSLVKRFASTGKILPPPLNLNGAIWRTSEM